MAPRHPRGAASGNEIEAGASAPTSAPRDGRQSHPPAAPRDDSTFIEEVVRDMLAQNERARSDPSPGELSDAAATSARGAPASSIEDTFPSRESAALESPHTSAEPTPRTPELSLGTTTPSARAASSPARAASSPAPAPAPAAPPAERPRTVRVERDSGFRTAEGVAAARAYLPAKTVAPGRTEPIEVETVKVSDPRKLPTIRLPRERREEILREGAGRGPRVALPEDSAPTLRSAPAKPPSPQAERSTLALWIAGVVAVAVFGVLVVALAARFWPSVAARPAPSIAPRDPAPSPSGALTTIADDPSSPPTAASPVEEHPAAPPSALPSAAPSSEPTAAPRGGSPAPRSDRWF